MITHTTAFVTPVVEHWLQREIAQWVHPMKDRSDDPSHHERTLLPRSYISLPGQDRAKGKVRGINRGRRRKKNQYLGKYNNKTALAVFMLLALQQYEVSH